MDDPVPQPRPPRPAVLLPVVAVAAKVSVVVAVRVAVPAATVIVTVCCARLMGVVVIVVAHGLRAFRFGGRAGRSGWTPDVQPLIMCV